MEVDSWGYWEVDREPQRKWFRTACDAKGVELSIVRAGALKGGGPGREELDTELGLSKIYYNSIFELQQAMVTMAHDKFTLGAHVVAGDVPMANGLQQTMNKASFEPKPDESNRNCSGWSHGGCHAC